MRPARGEAGGRATTLPRPRSDGPASDRGMQPIARGRRGRSAASPYIIRFKVRKQNVQPSAGVTHDAADIEAHAQALGASLTKESSSSSSSPPTLDPVAPMVSSSSMSSISAPSSSSSVVDSFTSRVVDSFTSTSSHSSSLNTTALTTTTSPPSSSSAAPKSFMGKASFRVAKRKSEPMRPPDQPQDAPSSVTKPKSRRPRKRRQPEASSTVPDENPAGELAPSAEENHSDSPSDTPYKSPIPSYTESLSTTSPPQPSFTPSSSTQDSDSSSVSTSSSDPHSRRSLHRPSSLPQEIQDNRFSTMVHSGAHPIGSGLVHRRPSLPNAAGPKKRKKRSKKKMNTGENKSSKITLEEEEHEEKKQEPSSDIRESEARESSEEDADDERRSEDLSRLDSAQGSSEDDEGQNVRIGVWNSQMKLSTDTTALVLMSAYERYLFPFTPLHPLVMHEDSVRLCLREYADDASASPLTVNVNIALCLAANVLGDLDRAQEFYNRARAKVGRFFDASDYTIAEALATMAYFAFGQGDMERVSYYIDLAAAICREVGAYNSDTYAKCMIGTVVDPMRTLEEKERVVMDYNRKAPLYPYFNKDRLRILAEAPSCLGGVKGPAKVESLRLTHLAGKCFADCLMTLADFKNRKSELERMGSEELREWERHIEHLKWIGEERDYPLPPFIAQQKHRFFLNSLGQLEDTLEKPELLGQSFGESAMLYHSAIKAQYALLLAREKECLDWALRFVDVLQGINVRLISQGIIPVIQMLFDILLKFERCDLVILCIQTLEPWIALFPFAQQLATAYLKLAQVMQAKQRTASSPAVPQPTTSETATSGTSTSSAVSRRTPNLDRARSTELLVETERRRQELERLRSNTREPSSLFEDQKERQAREEEEKRIQERILAEVYSSGPLAPAFSSLDQPHSYSSSFPTALMPDTGVSAPTSFERSLWLREPPTQGAGSQHHRGHPYLHLHGGAGPADVVRDDTPAHLARSQSQPGVSQAPPSEHAPPYYPAQSATYAEGDSYYGGLSGEGATSEWMFGTRPSFLEQPTPDFRDVEASYMWASTAGSDAATSSQIAPAGMSTHEMPMASTASTPLLPSATTPAPWDPSNQAEGEEDDRLWWGR